MGPTPRLRRGVKLPAAPRQDKTAKFLDAMRAMRGMYHAMGRDIVEHPVRTVVENLPIAELGAAGIDAVKAGREGSKMGVALSLASALPGIPALGKMLEKGEAKAARKAVHFFDHYSPVEGLTELDPKYMGTGLAGAERKRASRTPAMHVYRAGAKPEREFASLPKYSVRVEGDIYDVAKDPAGIVKGLQERVRAGKLTASDFADEMERAIQRRGFAGYHNSEFYGDTFKLFGKHPVERAGKKNPGVNRVDTSVNTTSVNPMPTTVGNPEIQRVLAQLVEGAGGRSLPRVAKVDPKAGARMAKVYESLPVNDAEAKAAYDALNAEVDAQFKAMQDAGFSVEFVDADPYKTSAEMMADVRDNRRLKVFKTADDQAHPYMTREQNDRFRAVHDWLAHAGEGHQFGPTGEENAYRVHASTLSPQAQRALASETRGQNSWVNFGPNAHLPPRERPFAQQKAALWPEEFLGDYNEFPPEMLEGAPAVHTPRRWQPTERGVFDRNVEPMQGTAPIDPRLQIPDMPRSEPSPLVEAISRSKSVAAGLRKDAEEGLPLGGDVWYEPAAIKADLDARPGATPFREMMNLFAVSSSQNPTTRELSTASVLNYALRNQVPLEDAVAALMKMTGSKAKPWVNEDYLAAAKKALDQGLVLPADPKSEAWKLPWYNHGKLGGSLDAGVALDTHERRRIMQLVADNPRLERIARQTGATAAAEKNAGRLPLRNALDYDVISDLYRRQAQNLGLPSAQAFQAGRWIGGGKHTGLMSQPEGDFLQTLEDGLLYTADTRGMDTNPAGLRALWDRIAKGQDFFMPYYGSGGFPVYGK